MPKDPYSQDWEWEVADAERIDEFISAYENGGLSEDERFTLMEMIMQSFEDLSEPLSEDLRWSRILEIIHQNVDLHVYTIWYWSNLDDATGQIPALEDSWKVAPYLRAVWEKHRDKFQD